PPNQHTLPTPTSSVPSLSTCGSSSTASSPAPSFSPSSVKSKYSTKGGRHGSKPVKQYKSSRHANVHHIQIEDRSDSHHSTVDDSSDENDKLEYYMQRTGSHPTQSLQSKPNVISSYRQTGPKLSSKLNRRTTNNPISSFEINPAHDPRDPMVEKTTQWTIRRDDNEAIEKPSPSLDSKNSTRTPEPPRPLGLFLYQFSMLVL
ncbi:hypothetical protein GGU11DRAFT_764742, partial [Lentinula aff. detonsa]